MWRFNEEGGYWEFDGFTEIYIIQKRILEYPLTTCLEKLNLSITEAAICTRQKVEYDNFKEWRKRKQ